MGITSDLPIQCNCDTDWIRIVGKPFHGEHNEVNQRDVNAWLPGGSESAPDPWTLVQ